jgi:arylsulfatase A-like enzyme
MHKLIAACLALLCIAGVPAMSVGKTAKPNIIIILADDQGWGDLSVNGNTNLRTPNIDSLARQGATFDRFYVCPVCAPTRAEFLTGRYHSRGGVRGVSTGQERLNADERTIAQVFQAAGYATGAFGKWHNGSQWPYHPNARGFDEYYGFTSGHWGEYFDPPLEHNGKFVRGKGFIADDFTDHALAFIETNRARPFFCYLPFNTPHSPFSVPDEYWNRFKDKPIAMRGGDGAKEDIATTRAALALCENIDWNVGRVLRRLGELKLADDTIVVYFSDNGPNSRRWNGGMKGIKGTVDEGGVRVPFFIRWPGRIKAGTSIRDIAGAMDLLPTLASLAGVPVTGTKPLDGRDLSPLLLGKPAPWPDRMIFSHQRGKVSVRTQRYRLDDGGALFDMVADPGQSKDVSKEHPEVTTKLADAVAAWRKEVLPTNEDDRPYPVGFAEFPMTPLPARDGVPHGHIQRSAGAPNCSYFKNWTGTNDFITWDIEVNTTGSYEVTIYYTCPEADVGSTVELSFNGSKSQGRVSPAWNPPLITDQDRVPRRGESYMKEFRPLTLGKLRLQKGRGVLTLRALAIPGRQVMDMRMVTLTLVKAR